MGQGHSSCSVSSCNITTTCHPEIPCHPITTNSSSSKCDLTLYLPDECLATVFAKLGCHDRNSCSLVCKRWNLVDSKSRHRIVLLARSEMSPSLPALLCRFSCVSILSLKCSRKLLSIDDDAVSRIPIFLPSLKKLKLKGCIHISDDGLHGFSLHRPPLLTKLAFASCGFGAKGLNSLLANCPSLQDLTLKRLRKLDAQSSTQLASWVGANFDGDGDDGKNKRCHHPLERLCIRDLHNARLFAPLICSCSKAFKTLIVARSSGDWDKVLESSLNGKISAISEIQMENVQMGDAGLVAISSSCPDLQVLYLSRTTDCTDDGLSAIANSCKKLRKLHIDAWSRFGSRSIGDEGVSAIANKCLQLQELVLMGVPVTIPSLNALASNCQALERMALCNTDSVKDSEMAFIAAKFTSLKKLCIKNCPISKSGIEAIGVGCPNLVKLKVKRCRGINQVTVSKLRMQRSSIVVSVDAGSMLFDGEGMEGIGEEEEQGNNGGGGGGGGGRRMSPPPTTTALPNTRSTTHVICSSRGALLLRSKFESALQIGRRRPNEVGCSSSFPRQPAPASRNFR